MLKTFSRTDIGLKRKLNQDYIYTSEEASGSLSNVFIVADGMGGHAAGDYASKKAVEVMVRELEEPSGEAPEENPGQALRRAVEAANREVYRKAAETPALEGMGTTLVAATLEGNRLYAANVGDSRLYVISGRDIRQVTVDHSLVEEMVRSGLITKEAARTHPDKNKITRAVGVMPYVQTDLFSVRLDPGDYVLLCTDGLTNMVEDEEIRRIVCAARDVTEAVVRLVDTANEQGGKDNISVVLIEYVEEEGRADAGGKVPERTARW